MASRTEINRAEINRAETNRAETNRAGRTRQPGGDARLGWGGLEALFSRLPGAFQRPLLFDLIFWGDLVVALVSGYLGFLGDVARPNGLLLSLVAVTLVAAWLALPWDPAARTPRKLAVPVFLLATFALGQLTVFLWGMPLYAMAVANAVFLLGFRPAVVIACLTPLLVALNTYLGTGAVVGVAGAAFMGALMIPVAGFVFGICKLLAEAVQSRQESQRLLTTLEAVNAELRRQASKIRELAVSEERARVAREVHDALGHHLTAINLQLQNAERFSAHDPARALTRVQEARASTLEALSDVRRSVRALKPHALETQTLISALGVLTRSFGGTELTVSLVVSGDGEPAGGHCSEVGAEIDLALYRAAQEALTNATRHAGAGSVEVALRYTPAAVTLSVCDDGHGVSDGVAAGFGLTALRERVGTLGGTLSAQNRAAGGFELVVAFPLPPTARGAETRG